MYREKTINFSCEHIDYYDEPIIDGVITKKNRGGFITEPEEINSVIPQPLSALKDSDLAVIGRQDKAHGLQIDEDEDSILAFTALYFVTEERIPTIEIADSPMPHTPLAEGGVKKITSYGMFVDAGGRHGLPATMRSADKLLLILQNFLSMEISLPSQLSLMIMTSVIFLYRLPPDGQILAITSRVTSHRVMLLL